MSVDGRRYCDFRHRVAFSLADVLDVRGHVDVDVGDTEPAAAAGTNPGWNVPTCPPPTLSRLLASSDLVASVFQNNAFFYTVLARLC